MFSAFWEFTYLKMEARNEEAYMYVDKKNVVIVINLNQGLHLTGPVF